MHVIFLIMFMSPLIWLPIKKELEFSIRLIKWYREKNYRGYNYPIKLLVSDTLSNQTINEESNFVRQTLRKASLVHLKNKQLKETLRGIFMILALWQVISSQLSLNIWLLVKKNFTALLDNKLNTTSKTYSLVHCQAEYIVQPWHNFSASPLLLISQLKIKCVVQSPQRHWALQLWEPSQTYPPSFPHPLSNVKTILHKYMRFLFFFFYRKDYFSNLSNIIVTTYTQTHICHNGIGRIRNTLNQYYSWLLNI